VRSKTATPAESDPYKQLLLDSLKLTFKKRTEFQKWRLKAMSMSSWYIGMANISHSVNQVRRCTAVPYITTQEPMYQLSYFNAAPTFEVIKPILDIENCPLNEGTKIEFPAFPSVVNASASIS